MPARSRRGGGTLGRVAGGAYVFDRFIWRIGAHHQQRLDFAGGADPAKLTPVELNFGSARELLKIKIGGNLSDGQSVRFGDAVNVVCRYHGAAAGHILSDDIGTTRNVFGKTARQSARPKIVDITRRHIDDERYGLAAVEVTLCQCGNAA